ncbi:hypothetical protein YTPLAS18_16430 [Nitrospira sp.]|nr:hypothetical protein YTPLAS18_16430 [Nitrospira sp.]
MGEIRRHARVALECPVVVYQDDGASVTGTVFDLSLGGCAIESEAAVPVESHVVLELRLIEDQPAVKVELGRVSWATRREFGVQFVLLDGASRARLERFFMGGSK